MTDKWFEKYIGIAPVQPTRTINFGDFTLREIEVMGWLARGLTIEQAAKKMLKPNGGHLSVHTATDYLKSLYKKLRIDNRSELTRIAIANGLIALPSEESLKKLIESCCQFSDKNWRAFEQISLGQENVGAANKLKMHVEEYLYHKRKIYEALNNFTVDGIQELSEAGSATKATISWVALKKKADILTGKAAPQTETVCPPTSEEANRNDRVHASGHNTQEPQHPSNNVLASEHAGRMDPPGSPRGSTSYISGFGVDYKEGADNDRLLTKILKNRHSPESPRLR